MSDETVIATGPDRRRVGKYLIEGVLGEGAMGVVYAARDPDIDRPVAIKTIHRHLVAAEESADWLERFSREARAAGRVLHPNLVTVFDFLVEDGLPFLVMERLRPVTLQDRVAAAPLAPDEVRGIAEQVLAGLACIHAVGVVHRDLKPANVMLATDGTVKLTDFGIARMTATEATGAGMIGTPAYMAPEQMAGQEVDARADIFALGVLLYELLTARKPFTGNGVVGLYEAVHRGPPPAPSAHVVSVPAGFDTLLLKAMALKPCDRFGSAAEMAAALRQAGGGGEVTTPVTAPQPPSALTTTMLNRLSPQTLQAIETRITAGIGPMGKVIVRRIAGRADSPAELVTMLLEEFPDPAERQSVRAQIETVLAGDGGLAAPKVSAEGLLQLTELIRPHMGPISSVLVRKTGSGKTGIEELAQRVADQIADPTERARFLSAVGQLLD